MQPFSYSTTKQDFYIKNTAFPQFHIVQPDIFMQVVTKRQFKELGILASFQVYFCINSMPAPLDSSNQNTSILEQFNNHIYNIINNNYAHPNREIKTLIITEQALKLINEFEDYLQYTINKTQSDNFKSYISKLHGQAVRFATDIHLFNNAKDPQDSPVNHMEMYAGISIAKMLMTHASMVYKKYGFIAYNHAKLIFGWILDWSNDKRLKFRTYSENNNIEWHTFKARDAQQSIKELKNDVRLVNDALDLLEHHNIISQIQIGNTERICLLHPDFFNLKIAPNYL